jgi:hypothetical protein
MRRNIRRVVLGAILATAALALVGDAVLHDLHAASCTPSNQEKCRACKNCRYCRHCAKNSGTCSVCR